MRILDLFKLAFKTRQVELDNNQRIMFLTNGHGIQLFDINDTLTHAVHVIVRDSRGKDRFLVLDSDIIPLEDPYIKDREVSFLLEEMMKIPKDKKYSVISVNDALLYMYKAQKDFNDYLDHYTHYFNADKKGELN